LKKTLEQLFAVTAPGLETVCAAELRALGIDDVRAVGGGVEFAGGLRELYLANLWLRSASRVVVRVGAVKCSDFPDLYRKTSRLPWGKFLSPTTPVAVRAASHRSRLIHTGRIAATIGEGVDSALGRSAPAEGGVTQQVLARFEDDLCLLSVDSSGELLHRRGYRVETAHAPLRETLAAGLLQLLGWKGDRPLFDPMCGSGTLVIEGALLAGLRAPGMHRSFAFMNWPGYRPGLWEALRTEARRGERSPDVLLTGCDRDVVAIEAARRNGERAGLGEGVIWDRRELTEQLRRPGPGLLLCNPPYGERLGRGEDLRPLYRQLGQVCRDSFSEWQVAILCPDERLARATGLPLEKRAGLVNGGIDVALYSTRS
jgi:putative N6-adenine-specific DNA methylase